MSRNFLGDHPILYKSVNNSTERSPKPLQSVNMEVMAQQLIEQQNERIYDLQMHIKAFKIKIEQEKQQKLDHSAQIAVLESQVRAFREEQAQILQQIENCRKVENQVAPMEYYLWKKKQRVNTYDASIAQLCREVQQHRQYLERSIEEHRRLNEQLINEIDELEERIARFDTSFNQSISPMEVEEEELADLFAQNINLKKQIQNLSNNNPYLYENVQILEEQVDNNVDSTVSALKSLYQQEKTRLVREFKQLQAESKLLEVGPLTRQEQIYIIEPLLNDYSHKMAELGAIIPERLRKTQAALQPLPWKTFNWSEYLDLSSGSESVYDQYTRLQKEFFGNQKEIQQHQLQLRKINSEIANQQQKFNEIFTNISKLKKRLDK